MDEELKKEVLAQAAPAAVPILRFAIRNHFEEKRIDKRQQHEVRMAKEQGQALAQATGGKVPEPEVDEDVGDVGDDYSPRREHERDERNGVVAEENPLDEAVGLAENLDSALGRAQEHEQCEFCQDVLRELEHRPLPEQKQGLRELRELQDVMYSDASAEEIEDTMENLQLVPKMIVGGDAG